MRTPLIFFLCVVLLSASTAWAGHWENDEYVPEQDYPAGRGKTLLFATLMGAGIGFVFSGMILIFYWNPEADENYDAVMYFTVPICTLGGMAMGLTLPPDAANEGAAASLRYDEQHWNLDWRFPRITAAVLRSPLGPEPFWHANLFQMTF